ncbi:hypothetical protein K469DRAFT_461352, partial [Zopfia rhizophila CBS 207.26]
KMSPTNEYDIPTRAAIVALRSVGLGWTEISEKLGNCSPSGAQHLWERIVDRAGSTSLPNLLKHLEDAHRDGRPERFPEGGSVEERLVEMATTDEEHQDLPWRKVAIAVEEDLGIRI